jgi:hypothetical protein
MQQKLISACLAVAACTAFAVLPSIASAAPTITHPTGTVLGTGSKITATSLSEVLFLAANGASVRCTGASLTGELTQNNGKGFAANITSANFLGSGKNGDCTSEKDGDVFVTPTVATSGQGLPWCLTWKEADSFHFRGGRCSENNRPIRFGLDFTLFGECTYFRDTREEGAAPGPAKGSFQTDLGPGQDAVLEVFNQEWTLEAGGMFCPKVILLNMELTLETDATMSSPLYIS